MKCENCNRNDLKEIDFYWHQRESKTLKNKKCKDCLRKEREKKNEENKMYQF